MYIHISFIVYYLILLFYLNWMFFPFFSGSLISRVSMQRSAEGESDWIPDNYDSTAANTSISFEYRVTCDSNYYGAGCGSLCRDRDDAFGHYSCDSNGKRVCFTGWTGEYCEKRKFKLISARLNMLLFHNYQIYAGDFHENEKKKHAGITGRQVITITIN